MTKLLSPTVQVISASLSGRAIESRASISNLLGVALTNAAAVPSANSGIA